MFRWLAAAGLAVIFAIGAMVIIAKVFVDCEKTENGYAYFTCAVANPKLFVECRTRFKEASSIDWRYVQTQLAAKLNKRRSMILPGYDRTIVPDDVSVDVPWTGLRRLGALSKPLETISFEFSIPNHERRFKAIADRCGYVDFD